METILEQQRRYHEERERLQDSMVKEMMHVKKTVCEFFDEIIVTLELELENCQSHSLDYEFRFNLTTFCRSKILVGASLPNRYSGRAEGL